MDLGASKAHPSRLARFVSIVPAVANMNGKLKKAGAIASAEPQAEERIPYPFAIAFQFALK